MKKAVLLPNMVEFPSTSMARLADETETALRALNAPDWEFERMECHHVAGAARLLPGSTGEKMASRLGRFVRYPALAARARGDVFHVLDHSHANLALSLPGSKTLMACHDIIPYLAAQGLVPIAPGRVTRYTFPLRMGWMKRCRYITTISENTKRDMIEHGGFASEQIRVVYLGCNRIFHPLSSDAESVEERRELRRQWRIPQDARVVLHVGTPGRYKNTPALFHALQYLRAEPLLEDRVYLVRVGAPFYPDEEALLDELVVRDRVIPLGRVAGDEALAACYRAADVLAFPSLYEGFGWPPLEAMACGTPVVTSNAASLPEIVGDAGLTTPPQDYEALAGALSRVLTEDALRAEMRRKGLEQAGRFTWERYAKDLLGIYDEVVAGA